MKRFAPLAATVLLLTMTGLAQAGQTIASPSIYWSSDQSSATCTIRNVGPTQVSVQVGIFDESGGTVPLSEDHCNGVNLAGGSACSVTATGISTGFAYACSATASSVKHLRGAMFLRFNSQGAVPIRSAPLR